MSLDVVERAEATRRRRSWVLAVTAGLGVLLLVATALAFVAGGDEQEPASSLPAAPANPGPLEAPAADPPAGGAGAPAPTGAPAQAWVPPARQVVLPAGTDQIEEFPVGFPQTPEGAAAAEVAKDRYSTTLDYQLATSVARVYLAPDLAAVSDQAAVAAVQELREKVDAPVTGAVPAAVGAVARPIGVQWVAETSERTTVSVLVQVDYRAPDRSWSELAASTTVWQWLAGPDGRAADWRLVDARRPAAGLAQIGTQAFNDEGWAALVTETGR